MVNVNLNGIELELKTNQFFELLFSGYFGKDYKEIPWEVIFANLNKLERIKQELEKKYFYYEDLFVSLKGDKLVLINDEVEEELKRERVEEIMEVFRFGAFTGSGFITYGVGKLSILKPDGSLRLGRKVYTQMTDFVFVRKKVPEALARIYLFVR